MAYTSAEGGDGAKESLHINASHVDASHVGVVEIPDADLLFRGDFKRVGPDLHLSSHDGRHLAIHGYFDSEHPATLVAPNGAHLSSDVVHLLAGHGQYAEAQKTVGVVPDVVGRVEKIAGDASVVRNGVAVELHVGDAIYKGDIVQTGASGSLGIAFADGTALSLAANTRMAISEYSYDANSTSNAALFTAIEGTFAFVAGKVAHIGDMKIATPVATMAIHGTTGWSHQLTTDEIKALKVLTVTSNLGDVIWSFAVTDDDGVHTHGVYDLLRNGVTTASVSDPGYLWYLDIDGNLSSRQMSGSEQTSEQNLLQDLFQWFNVMPASITGIHDSGGIPSSFLPSPTVFNDQPISVAPQVFGGGTPGFVPFSVNDLQFTLPPASTVFIWNSNGPGSWSQQLGSWNQGFAPNASIDTVFIQTGNSNYDIDGGTAINFLTVDLGATLGITLGQLFTGGLLDNGTIVIGGDPPEFTVNGPSTIGLTGKVTVEGALSEGIFNGEVLNAGVMTARFGGELLLADDVTNNGKIVSRGYGSLIDFSANTVDKFLDNFGDLSATRHGAMTIDANLTNELGSKVEASRGGVVDFEDDSVSNFSLIDATGYGSRINFAESTFENLGIAAADFGGKMVTTIGAVLNGPGGLFIAAEGGQIAFDGSYVTNAHRAEMLSVGQGADIIFSDDTVDNSGHVVAEYGGKAEFKNLGATTNESGAVVEARDGGVVTFESSRGNLQTVINDRGARIEAEDGGFVGFYDVTLTNDRGALIEAQDFGVVEFVETRHAPAAITNHGTIEAEDGGLVEFIDAGLDRNLAVTNTGLIEALQFGVVDFDNTKVDNLSGDIAAIGWGSRVELDSAFISGGRLETAWGGLIETGYRSGASTLDDVTIERGSNVEIGGRSTLVFSDNTVMYGGNLAIDYAGTLQIEGSDVLNDVNVTNDGDIQVDYPSRAATLTLEAGTEITGGTLSIGRSGEVDIERGFNVQGATLNDVSVENDGLIQVDFPDRTTTLTLEGGTEISGGTLSVGRDGVVDVEYGSNSRLHGATFDGVTVDNDGKIEVGEDRWSRPVVALFESGATVDGGDLLIGRAGVVDVEYGTNRYSNGATFDGVTVENDGTFEVGEIRTVRGQPAVALLDDGTEIDGGTLKIGAFGTVDVEYGSNGRSHGATFDGVTVDDTAGGTIEIGETSLPRGRTAVAVLDDGATVTGGMLSIGGSGELDIESGFRGPGATLDDVDVVNDGAIYVDLPASPATLILDGGATITGGTLSIGDVGTVDVEYGTNGHSHGATFAGVTVDNDGTFEVGTTNESNGRIAVATLEDGVAIDGGLLTVGEWGTVDVEYGSAGPSHGATFDGVTINNTVGGTFDVGETNPGHGRSAIALFDDGAEIDGGTLTVGAFGTLDVEYGVNASSHGATFDGVTIDDTAGGTFEVGKTNGAGIAIALLDDDTAVEGGTLSVGSYGKLDIKAGSVGSGATLDGVTVNDNGSVVVGAHAKLTIGDTVKLNDGGTVSMAAGSEITDNGSAATLDNVGTIISGRGKIDGSHLTLTNEVAGIIDADVSGRTLVLDPGAGIINDGLLEATNGATLKINSDVNNAPTTGLIKAIGTVAAPSTIQLDAVTVTDGEISIDANSTLAIENGATQLVGVDVENAGNIQVDSQSVTATLVLGAGTTVDGAITVGDSGRLNIHGASLNGVTINDGGIVDINGPLTLDGSLTINLDGGTFIDTGVLKVAANTSATLSGASFGQVDIGHGATLTLDNANATTVDFTGSDGTLVLDNPSGFNGAITGLAAGDVIDLVGVLATNIVLDGATLLVNGVAMPFTIPGGLLAGDAFAFKDDGQGGTNIEVTSNGLTVTTQTVEGTEGSAIPLSITDTVHGATVTSVVITGIPVGATLTNSNHDVLVLDNGNTIGTLTITLTPAQLAGLMITPPNDSNFTLSLLTTATLNDNSGYDITVQSSETVTVDPLAPLVAWTAGSKVVDGEGSPIGIALTDSVGAKPGDGSHNSITSVVISGIQVGAILSDGTHTFTATATDTSEDVSHWTLADLTITPASDLNFGLTATVTESDSDSPAQTHTAQAQISVVTGTDWTTAAGGDWSTAADWDNGIPIAGLGATIDSSLVHATSDYTVAVNGQADVAGELTLNDAHATLDVKEDSSLAIGGAVTVDQGTLTIEDGSTMSANGTFTVHGGFVDVYEGFDAVPIYGIPESPGGVLTVGALVVDGGEVLIQPDTTTQQTPGGGPAGTLNAASINVLTGGTVELDGNVNVTGLIETTGGNLIIGGNAEFGNTDTDTVTFGGSTGTVTLTAGTSSFGTPYFSGSIAGFGPGDVIDLPDVAFTQNSLSSYPAYGNGTYLGYGSANLDLIGNYAASDFLVESDGTPIGLTGQTGSKIVWALSDVTMTLSENPETDLPYGTVQVTVTVKDPNGNPVEGVSVQPSYVSNAGQGAFTYLNSVFGDNNAELTGSDGTATFTFNAYGYAGTYDISALLNGVQTVSQQLIVEPEGASFRSSLTARLSFAGPQETAILTVADVDPNFNPQPGDAVGWTTTGAGVFSPASNAGVTDANGMLIDTFTPTSDTPQTITATFGAFDPQIRSVTVNFVAMDTWINSDGGVWNDAQNADVNWSSGIPTSGEAVWIGVAGTYTVNVTANESIFGLGTVSTATLELDSSVLAVTGTGVSVLAGALSDYNGSEFLVQNGTVQLNGAVTNNASLEAQSGGTIDIAGNVTGTGVIAVDGGYVSVAGSLANTQSITIQGAGVVHLAQAEGGSVTFQGPGMLALDAAPASGMLVRNFGRGDSIDLTNLAYSTSETMSWVTATNTLTIIDGATSESIQFGEGHSLSDFKLTADPLGTGGTDIVYNNNTLYYGSASSVVSVVNGLGIGGVNDAGVALVIDSSNDYFLVNGHLIQIAGAPADAPGGVGLYFGGGINNNQTIVVTGTNASGADHPETYTGTYDGSTNFNDASGGSGLNLTGPSQLQTGDQPNYFGQGLGINDSNEVVGYFQDAAGLTNYSRTFILNGPPLPRPDGGEYNPAGNIVHEYGFIYKPGIGYLTVDVGNTAQNAGIPQFTPSAGTSGFAASTGGSGYVEGNHAAVDGVAFTVLTDINNEGVAVGYYMDGESVQHAFIFNSNNDTFTYIPDLNANGFTTSTVATGINDAGIVVGFYSFAGGTEQEVSPQVTDSDYVYGFVYDSNTGQFITTDFSAPGIGDHIALTGINNNGEVTGEINGSLIVASLQPVVTIDDGGTLYVTAATDETINFGGSTGELVLSASFGGEITGFTGTGASASLSDVIDLVGVNFVEYENWGTNLDVFVNGVVVNEFTATGILTVHENGGGSYSLNMPGYTGDFAFASDGHGGTLIFDPPSDGPATVSAGELLAVTGNNSTVTFTDGTGALQIDSPSSFTGHIAGFTGTAPDAAHSDLVDIAGVDFTSAAFSSTYHAATGQLTLTDGANNASLTFDNFDGIFNFASDGNGGTDITDAPAGISVGATTAHGAFSFADDDAQAAPVASVTAEGSNYVGTLSVGAVSASNGSASAQWSFDLGKDQITVAAGQTVTQSYNVAVTDAHNPAANTSQTVAVSFGGSGNDNFVFAPGIGADTIMNFDLQHDTIDLSHFTNVQSVQQLSSMISSDSAGEAVIDLGNHDSITLAGVTAAQLLQVAQSAVHLH